MFADQMDEVQFLFFFICGFNLFGVSSVGVCRVFNSIKMFRFFFLGNTQQRLKANYKNNKQKSILTLKKVLFGGLNQTSSLAA